MDARFKSIFPFARISASCLSALLVVGCSDGSAVPDLHFQKTTGDNTETAKLTLGLTDAPVDHASAVIIEFTGVSFQPTGGEAFTHAFEIPQQVDVLSLQGGARELLLTDLEIPSGAYDWIRFDIDAKNDGIFDSYITIDGADYELELKRVPGLQMNMGFYVGGDQFKDLTIDFDLSKSIQKVEDTELGTVYRLSPTMRLVESDATGSVGGTIDPVIFAGMDCSSVDKGWAVYVYQGAGVTPDDIGGTGTEPVKVAQEIKLGDNGYEYRTSYLTEGEYTLAATCQADLDDPAVDDSLTFTEPVTVNVTMGEQTTHNF